MSAREWQPGDVAMSRYGRVFYSGRGDRASWTFDDGSGGFSSNGRPLQEVEPRDARPLVVIDPEDRGQVERLLSAYQSQYPLGRGDQWGAHADKMQAALREFADPTPPKPEEPTGLGAVVEDAAGKRYVRYEGDWPWLDGTASLKWQHLNAVRVLSEGVTP